MIAQAAGRPLADGRQYASVRRQRNRDAVAQSALVDWSGTVDVPDRGRVLFNDRVALLATGFHAVNGFLVALSSGRRVADHVDTALVFFVALGIWAALKSWEDPRTRDLVLTGVALGLAGLSKSAPARYLLEPTGSFERRERDMESSRELRTLSQGLGLADAVIFNIPIPIEARFYSPYTACDRMPTAEEVEAIRTRGISVVVDEPRGAPVDIPADWPIIRLEEATP